MKKIFYVFFLFLMINIIYAADDFQNKNTNNWESRFSQNDEFFQNSFDLSATKQASQGIGFDMFLFDNWLVFNSFDFDIYCYDDHIINYVIPKIDWAYSAIKEDLSFTSFDLPQRVKIYIYKNKNHYAAKTSGGNWTGGYCDIKKNAIYTYKQKNLMENVLVHELTHMVFDSYMGAPRNVAINWLHEGLAVYEEKRFFDKKWNLKYLKTKDKEGQLYSLSDAFKTEAGYEKNTEKIGLWYLQVGTVVAYLFTLDRAGFKLFCDNLKIYKNLNEALRYTYPWQFQSVDELDKKWRKWLHNQKDYF